MNAALLLCPKSNISYMNHDNTLRQGIETFRAHGYTAVPVLYSDGRYYGTVSDHDFLKYILDHSIYNLKDMESVCIGDIISKGNNKPVSIDASMEELLSRMMDSNFVPVVDGRNCFVGIVTRKTVLGYLMKNKISKECTSMSQ